MSTSPPAEERYGHWLGQVNYLRALRVLQRQQWEIESMRLQELSWLLGAVGRYREAHQVFNQAMGGPHVLTPPPQELLDTLAQVPFEPAEQLVLRAVETHQSSSMRCTTCRSTVTSAPAWCPG